MSKTKIIATIGPVSSSAKMIEKLIIAGMNVARLNFSHGTHEEHLKTIKTIRRVAKNMKCPIAILQDLQGPKIRTGRFENGSTLLKKGRNFTITTRKINGTDSIVGCTYKKLHKDVKAGDFILLNDGQLKLKVLKTKEKDILTKVIVGGVLSNNKGINLPGVNVSEPALTAKDRKDLAFGIQSGVDFVALSFVRHAKDIKQVTAIIKKAKSDIKVISKIEKPEAVANFEEILNNSDGVMIARGDLGVEIEPELVPAIQKKLIHLTASSRKFVVTATQMLESMIDSPVPTRAEASDVANAVYDGTDAIMLSGETASGAYPVEAVKIMRKIATASEKDILVKKTGYFTCESDNTISRAMGEAALLACEEIKGKTILVFTLSGNTARLIAKDKKNINITAFTAKEKTYNQMALYWGIDPMLKSYAKNNNQMVKDGIAIALKAKRIKKGEQVVILAGSTPHTGSSNMIRIETV